MGRRFGEGGVRNHRTRVWEAEEEISVFCIFYYLAAPLSPLIKWGAVCVCVGRGETYFHKNRNRGRVRNHISPKSEEMAPRVEASEFGRLDPGVVTNARSLERDRNRTVRLWRTCLTFLSLSSLSITKDSSYRILLL